MLRRAVLSRPVPFLGGGPRGVHAGHHLGHRTDRGQRKDHHHRILARAGRRRKLAVRYRLFQSHRAGNAHPSVAQQFHAQHRAGGGAVRHAVRKLRHSGRSGRRDEAQSAGHLAGLAHDELHFQPRDHRLRRGFPDGFGNRGPRGRADRLFHPGKLHARVSAKIAGRARGRLHQQDQFRKPGGIPGQGLSQRRHRRRGGHRVLHGGSALALHRIPAGAKVRGNRHARQGGARAFLHRPHGRELHRAHHRFQAAGGRRALSGAHHRNRARGAAGNHCRP